MSTIKISPSNPFMEGKSGVEAGKRRKPFPGKGASNRSATTERVMLSPVAKELAETHETEPAAAAGRSRYLAQIKKQVEQGTYEVKGREIAEKLFTTLLKDRDSLK